MKYQFFSIMANDPHVGQNELNKFCAGKKIIAVEKHFITDNENSFWAICLTYQESDGMLPYSAGNVKLDYKEILNEKDFAVFAKLRELRKALAEKEGIPAYSIFTNEQLAAAVSGKVSTQQALAKIKGIGKARVEKYGNIFLEILINEFGEKLQKEKDSSPPSSKNGDLF
jgi:superfamily II DNA helicase RecQ